MSFFNDVKNRHNQKKANAFIRSLENKNENEAKQAYLDNEEFHNNEIVLSYIFFHFPALISMLPIEFQKNMINSNINNFKYGSNEAKKSLVSDWLKDNKFFMNIKNLDLDQEEYENYICMYFNQVDDVSKLYMDDLFKVIEILSKHDMRMTENLIDEIKDKLTDRQWDFILKVSPIFIKYANESIQNKYAEDENFSMYVTGSAKDIYVKKQLERIDENIDLFYNMSIDIQKEYVIKNPQVINTLNEDTLVNLFKYDINLIKYIEIVSNKNKNVIYEMLENACNKNINEIVDIFVSKQLLNAKSKLYKYNSNNINYQYTKRLIKIIQSLSIEQIISLINIDVNYILPYIVPLYNDKDERSFKENETLEANSRCLNVLKSYYNDEIYSKYYKVVNKIYNEYFANIDKYNYFNDYESIFDLFKVIFNKKIIEKNNPEKISVFIGISLLYKGKDNKDSKNASIKLLNEILENTYNNKIYLDSEIYNINSLEIFDNSLSFISSELLTKISQSNNTYISTLLFIAKSSNNRKLFINYYEILKNIYGENINTLNYALRNYMYYKEILFDINEKELNDEEINNLIRLLVSKNNYLNITKKEELSSYNIKLLKRLISDISKNSDINYHKNLISNYLFNIPYDEDTTGFTIKNICDLCSKEVLEEFEIFNRDEINLFTTMRLLFLNDDESVLLSFIENIMNNKLDINILSIIQLFNKIYKYKIDIINKQVVSINDIEMLYENDKSAVSKKEENGVIIYTFNNQDFKILSSNDNDGINYNYQFISQINDNVYGYNKLTNGDFTISTQDNITLFSYYDSNLIMDKIQPNFIVTKNVNDNLIEVAKINNLTIIHMGDTNE